MKEVQGRIEKGDRGYLNKQRRSSLIRFIIPGVITLFLGLCSWVIFPEHGLVFLVLAVVSAIPTALALVNFIMYMRYTSCSEEDFEKIERSRGNVLIYYDGVITTGEKSYFVPCTGIINKNVMLYSKLDKKDEPELIKHITVMGKKNGFKDWHINIFNDVDSFIKRLSYLNEQNIKVLKTDQEMLKLISVLSL